MTAPCGAEWRMDGMTARCRMDAGHAGLCVGPLDSRDEVWVEWRRDDAPGPHRRLVRELAAERAQGELAL